MNILVTGTLGYDYIMDFSGRFADRIMPDKIHKISLSFLVDSLNKNFGGTAGNIGYSLKLLGMNPIIYSCAGNDFVPYKDFLEKFAIPTHGIIIHDNVATGSYFVVTDQDDNQIGSFFTGGSKYNATLSISSLPDEIGFCVVAPTDVKAMLRYVKDCKKKKIRYLFDPAFQIGSMTDTQLREGITGAEILIGNDYEIALMGKKMGITHPALRKLVPIVITTLGAKGSVVEKGTDSHVIPAAKVKNTSDPTGAGDAYRSGFLAGYLRKFDLLTCGRMGAIAAAYTVEKYGTITHIYTKPQFEKRYKDNFKDTIQL